ncbi:hypothetical protein Y032_0003g1518 [Ancylostoma ceylanicum]|uniref:Uncharacterized protein n=1 Tax=Ancylostoma ceylanicum TaxID=53326 RepID=A0A016VXJ8_9BILA|nr:hypothetical protein Y032_0003g1518 [Ancylostoma ceylanicum]
MENPLQREGINLSSPASRRPSSTTLTYFISTPSPLQVQRRAPTAHAMFNLNCTIDGTVSTYLELCTTM